MEEAETLSTRLAIMTKGGNIACQDSTLKIKNDYGKYFTVELTFRPDKDGQENDIFKRYRRIGPIPSLLSRKEVVEVLEDNSNDQLA